MRYYGVRAIKQRGEKILEPGKVPEDMQQPHIPTGRRLIAMRQDVDKEGSYEIASDVTHPADWTELLEAYEHGELVTFGLWLIEESILAHCPDEGRVHYDVH